jgi:hypothetical protein
MLGVAQLGWWLLWTGVVAWVGAGMLLLVTVSVPVLVPPPVSCMRYTEGTYAPPALHKNGRVELKYTSIGTLAILIREQCNPPVGTSAVRVGSPSCIGRSPSTSPTHRKCRRH